MEIQTKKVVAIHYTLKNDAGEVMDSSQGQQPLSYIQGIGMLIPGLEKELEGKKVGDKLQVVIEPKDAYGERDDQLSRVVPKGHFPSGDIQEGMKLQVGSDARPMVVIVTKVEGDEVTVDANHPMAGIRLHFDVEVTEVRDATQEELDHGHVHGPGGGHVH